jgi:hypothetical protein
VVRRLAAALDLEHREVQGLEPSAVRSTADGDHRLVLGERQEVGELASDPLPEQALLLAVCILVPGASQPPDLEPARAAHVGSLVPCGGRSHARIGALAWVAR